MTRDPRSGQLKDTLAADKLRRVCKPGDRGLQDQPGCVIAHVVQRGERI